MSEELAERRKVAPEISEINRRLDKGDARMTSIEAKLAENTELTRQIQQNTAGFVAFQEDLYRGTRLLCRCAKGIDFVLMRINKYWKPVAIVGVLFGWVANGFSIPQWAFDLLAKVIAG